MERKKERIGINTRKGFDNNSNKNNGKPNKKGSNLPTQIEINAIDLYQILTNLAVSARDAMKDQVGFIRISLRHVVMSEVHCIACAAIMNGEFIELAVTDNGTEIDPKLIRRIFDPFFTTKPVGEGYGVGVINNNGFGAFCEWTHYGRFKFDRN